MKYELIMEKWNRFLSENLETAKEMLARVEQIANSKKIPQPHNYQNGKIGNIKLSPDEIAYVERGTPLPAQKNDIKLTTALFAKLAKRYFTNAKKAQEVKPKLQFAILSFSLNVFSLLHPNRKTPSAASPIVEKTTKYLKHASLGLSPDAQNTILGLINKAIQNKLATNEDEQIAQALGFTKYISMNKILDGAKKTD